ncbi:MAG: EAL domain-containing protein [Nitrospirota bacterium]
MMDKKIDRTKSNDTFIKRLAMRIAGFRSFRGQKTDNDDSQQDRLTVKRDIETKVGIGFGLGLLVLVMISIASQVFISDFSASADLRKQTYEVIADIVEVNSLLNDIQSDQRGYVITGQEELLAHYHSKIATIHWRIKTVRESTSREPEQQKSIAALELLIAQMTEHNGQVIEIRRKQGRVAAQTLVMTGKGEQLMTNIDKVIDEFVTEETRLLNQHDETLRLLGRATSFIVMSGLLLAVIIVVVSVVIIRNEIAERNRAEVERKRLFSFSIDMFCIAGFDGFFKQLNPAWEKTLGWTQKELMSKPYLEFIHPEDRELAIDMANRLKKGKSVVTFETRYQCKDGSYKWVSWNCYPLVEEQLIFSVARDITEQKQMSAELKKSHDDLEVEVQVRTSELAKRIKDLHILNRALKTAGECNQILVHATEENELLNGMCKVLVETGGYCLAWIGYAGVDEAESVNPVAHAGYDEGYLAALNTSRADDERGKNPAGTAIRTGKPVIISNMLSDEHHAFLRKEAIKRGYASCISLPLIADARVFGTLNIYASHPYAFDEQEVNLLIQFSKEISYGIMALHARDERRCAVEELKQEKHFTENALNNLKDLFFVFDLEGKLLRWNKAANTVLGLSDEEVSSMKVPDFFSEEDAKRLTEAIETIYKEGEGFVEAALITKDGRHMPYDFRGSVLKDHKGKTIGISGVGRDVTDRKHSEETIKKLSHRNELILNSAGEGILGLDKNGYHTFVNPAAARMLGYAPHELIGKDTHSIWHSQQVDGNTYPEEDCPIHASLHDGAVQTVNHELFLKKDGTLFPVEYTSTPIEENDKITGTVVTFRDITERKQMEGQLEYLAYYDSLTGLPNRNLFIERVNQAIVRTKDTSKNVAVSVVNIERFKLISGSYGHAFGDDILKAVGERLSHSIQTGNIAARLGNDEFGIALINIGHVDDIILILEKIIKDITQNITVKNEKIRLSFNTGISFYPSDGNNAAELLKSAGLALSTAKKNGRKSFQFYTEDMDLRAAEIISLEKELAIAHEKKEFILHYQPYWDITTNRIIGMEALIRWQKKDKGLVPPEKVIPVLEETGMILEVGEWSLKEAIRQVKEWQDKMYPVVPVSVNISPIQFRQKNLAERVKKIMGESGFYPSLLTLEITESAFMQNVEITSLVIKELKDIGVSVSIDDFGTGYSSLAYLKRFPIDNLKIDITFIKEMVNDPDSASIVMAIINMAHALNLKIIAEGVETKEQWKFLRLLKCDMGQGYYFSKPLPAEEVERLFNALAPDKQTGMHTEERYERSKNRGLR